MKLLSRIVLLLCLSYSASLATVYTKVVGDYASIDNLCPGDTLRFVGDSTNTFYYGVIQGWVRNSQTQSYDNFTITSNTNLATSYEHVLVPGDSSFYYQGMPFDLLSGGLFFNCLTSTEFVRMTNQSLTVKIYTNSLSNTTIIESSFNGFGKGELSVYDVTGRVIKRFGLVDGYNYSLIDYDSFSNSLFIYVVSDRNKILSTGKFILVRQKNY